LVDTDNNDDDTPTYLGQTLNVLLVFHELLLPLSRRYFATPLQQENKKNEQEKQRESKMNQKKGKESLRYFLGFVITF
jgi:hypothetical protein